MDWSVKRVFEPGETIISQSQKRSSQVDLHYVFNELLNCPDPEVTHAVENGLRLCHRLIGRQQQQRRKRA